jgi:hypothetical protein
MKAPETVHGEAFPIQAVYSIASLARMANVTTPRMRRMLRACGVELFKAGRQLMVPLDELREKIPVLWRNIALSAQLRSRGLPENRRDGPK